MTYTKVLLAAVLLGAFPAAAQQRDGSWEYSLGAGAMYHDAALTSYLRGNGFARTRGRLAPALAARLGYNINRHFGFSIGVAGGREARVDDQFPYIVTNGAKYLTPFAAVTLTGNVQARFSPFITGGTQFTRITGPGNRVTHPTWGAHVGAGIRQRVAKNASLRLEARIAAEHYAELPNAKTAYNSIATIGLSFFSAGRKAPKPVYRPAPPARVDTLWRTAPCNCAQPAPLVLRDSLVLEGVNFDFDSDRLTDDSKDILNQVAAELQQSQWVSTKWEVGGHTSSIGSVAYNQSLSWRRAEAVRDYLIRRGVAANRLEPKGYGESRPRFPEAAEGDNWRNRRVELIELRRMP